MPEQEKHNKVIRKFENNRILIIDDNDNIHTDFKKILVQATRDSYELEQLEAVIFEKDIITSNSKKNQCPVEYTIEHALSGEEGIKRVMRAQKQDQPYALIFVDIRMPPGMDGIKVTRKIWEINAQTEIVLCTAFSDYSWENIVSELGASDQLLFLKKPFNSVEVKQMCYTLVSKWNTGRQRQARIEELEKRVGAKNPG